MKPDHNEEIERRKSRLDKRLARDSWPEKNGPVLDGGNEHFEMSERVRATSFGGVGLVHRLVRQIGLPKLIDDAVPVFKIRCPYHESDHVLNIGTSPHRLQHRLRRTDSGRHRVAAEGRGVPG